MAPVASTVQERTGHRVVWNQSSAADAEADRAVADLLARPLTADAVAQVALLNNRSLRATYEDVGVAQADLVRAGLLRNPIFEAQIRFAEGGGGTNVELAVAQEFLGILAIPLKQKVAAANLAAAQQRVTGEVLATVAETKAAYYEAVAARQAVETRKVIAEATAASALLSRRLNEAGNISDLDRFQEQALAEQAKLELARAEVAEVEAREKLNRLLGVFGERTAWTTADRLPDPPADDVPAAGLESLAVTNRADLLAARAAVDAAAASAAVPLPLLWWEDGGELGASAERDAEGGWVVGPAVAIPIPIFDTGQATVSARRAEYRAARDRHAALAVQVRSEVRLARAKLAEARARAAFMKDVLLPLRARVLEQTQLTYNAMHTGLSQLLLAKQEQVRAGMEYVEALRDYWAARAELERAVGGKLPGGAPAPATQPAATEPAHVHPG
ncbi:MAG TPA: TolC family protein [Humisphaera sp.]